MGDIKAYDVSGMDSGNGNPFPAGTVLRLRRSDAVAMGLAKPDKKADAPAEGDTPEAPAAKPRKAPTRKRPAPAKRPAAKTS